MEKHDTVEVMGLRVNNLDERAVIDHVLRAKEQGLGGWLVTPNLDFLRQIHADPALQPRIANAHLVIADGMPLIWSSRITGKPLPERVTGSQLIWSLSEGAAKYGLSIFLLGGKPGVAEKAADALSRRIPSLRVAGTHTPPFGFEDRPKDLFAMHEALEVSQPDIVFCGLGFPKQEILMEKLFGSYPGTWFVGCGGSLSMAAGDVRRAPVWVQRIGLEWFYRLAQEPRRLFVRYVVHDIPFVFRLLAWSLRTRVTRGPRPLLHRA